MAYQGINTGSVPNDGTGDTLLDGAKKVNDNFSEIYNLVGDGTDLFVGIVTQINAGTNVSISTEYGSVEITSLIPSQLSSTNLSISGVSTFNQINTSGIVTSMGGFISTASTSACQITFSGNTLTFTVVGVGSTTLTLV